MKKSGVYMSHCSSCLSPRCFSAAFPPTGAVNRLDLVRRSLTLDFPGGSDSKAYNEGDLGSNPGPGRSSGEGNAPHSSILAWKIPWMEEPGKLQSVGSQRVGHD